MREVPVPTLEELAELRTLCEHLVDGMITQQEFITDILRLRHFNTDGARGIADRLTEGRTTPDDVVEVTEKIWKEVAANAFID